MQAGKRCVPYGRPVVPAPEVAYPYGNRRRYAVIDHEAERGDHACHLVGGECRASQPPHHDDTQTKRACLDSHLEADRQAEADQVAYIRPVDCPFLEPFPVKFVTGMLGKQDAEYPECQDTAGECRDTGSGKSKFRTSEVAVYKQVVPDDVEHVGS